MTNNAVQKHSPNYGAFEDGNQLSFAAFQTHLNNDSFNLRILPQMKYYSAVATVAARRKLNPNRRKHCFEIFGFDFIVDGELEAWLIEANTNPCLEESSQLL